MNEVVAFPGAEPVAPDLEALFDRYTDALKANRADPCVATARVLVRTYDAFETAMAESDPGGDVA